jgi:chromosome segregation ATPase
LGEVDKIEDPHEKNKAYHHLRVALNKAIPLLNVSKTPLEHEISQLQITISSQNDAVDIHKSKVKNKVKLLNEASHSEDADLTTQVDDLRAEFTKLHEEHATLDQDYQIGVQKLGVLTTQSSVLTSETTLWETILKQIKQAISQTETRTPETPVCRRSCRLLTNLTSSTWKKGCFSLRGHVRPNRG